MIATVTLNPSLDEWVTLPSLRVGRLHRATSFERYPGGKGINVSRVVHELGEKTRAFALAGGEDGVILRQLMNQFSIRHDFVTVSGVTRNNYKILTEHPVALTELNTPGPHVTEMDLEELKRRILRYRKHISRIVFSGSLPPGVPSSIYKLWIQQFQRLGIRSVLDASGAAFLHGIGARPWLIKPNRQEAEELLGQKLKSAVSLRAAMRKLLSLGPRIAILSLGGEGALMACDSYEGVCLAKPPNVRVNSAVGAGDSLVGGFIVGSIRSYSLEDCFRLGVACGSATAMTPGTELCHRKDVLRLFRRVVINRLQ